MRVPVVNDSVGKETLLSHSVIMGPQMLSTDGILGHGPQEISPSPFHNENQSPGYLNPELSLPVNLWDHDTTSSPIMNG